MNYPDPSVFVVYHFMEMKDEGRWEHPFAVRSSITPGPAQGPISAILVSFGGTGPPPISKSPFESHFYCAGPGPNGSCRGLSFEPDLCLQLLTQSLNWCVGLQWSDQWKSMTLWCFRRNCWTDCWSGRNPSLKRLSLLPWCGCLLYNILSVCGNYLCPLIFCLCSTIKVLKLYCHL